MEPDVWAALEELAGMEERSVSYLLNRLAREHLKSQGLLPERDLEIVKSLKEYDLLA